MNNVLPLPEKLVKLPKAHTRLLIVVTRGAELRNQGISPEQLGINLGHLGDLASLITPSVNLWWSRIFGYVDEICKPEILKQHPKLGNLDVSSVSVANLEKWFSKIVEELGAYLPIRPIK